MSISSIILGLIASGFAINSAGNLKGAWQKSVDSYKATSFVSPKVKKSLDVIDKAAKTGGLGLIAIQSLTQDKIPTIGLQSVVNMLEGKLPKTEKQMSKNIAQVGEDVSSIFASKKPKEVNKKESLNIVTKTENNVKNQNLTNENVVLESSESTNNDHKKSEDSTTIKSNTQNETINPNDVLNTKET